jgi:hypothetical protein
MTGWQCTNLREFELAGGEDSAEEGEEMNI